MEKHNLDKLNFPQEKTILQFSHDLKLYNHRIHLKFISKFAKCEATI